MIAALIAAAVSVQIVPFLTDHTKVRVIADGLDGPDNARISLHLIDEGKIGPAIFGSTKFEASRLIFQPTLKLSRGRNYVAQLAIKGKADVLKSEPYQVPNLAAVEPRVAEIYPTSKVLPANLLKFYLYFSQPMREGRAIFDQIHLEDADGNEIHAPWRRLELWSDDAKRLTLWIHPGRVKRGVNLREELGPVLKPDASYTLVIDATVQSAAGLPLTHTVRHQFRTSEEDFTPPNLETWLIQKPLAGSKEPLVVLSPEPLDHALLQRHVTVEDPKGDRVILDVQVNQTEKAWTMVPLRPWGGGKHRLIVSEFLEDLAGNTRSRVFDTDLNEKPPEFGPAYLEFDL